MRIQLELNEKGTQLLGEIRSAIGETDEGSRMSHRELFDYAITFLHWGIKERQKNRIIASLDEHEKDYRELIMPIFTWVSIAVPQAAAAAASAGSVGALASPVETQVSAAAAGKNI